MADEIKYDSTQPVRSQASGNYTPTGLSDQGNLDAYNANREQKIQNVYDRAQNSTLQGLKTAYDQNLSNLQAARDQITPQYQQSANQLAAEYERQRRNNNMQGAANGLNTGAGSQLALGQSMAYQRNAGNLARSENEALNEANRGIADLGVRYQNDIAQAVANNDYKRAAAMLDEYENQYQRQMNLENQNWQRAQQLENQAYQRAFNEENRDYNRAWNTEDRDYTRNWNTENRDYDRAWNLENRDYTRDWNQNERDYNRAWNEDERGYDRYWSENDRGYNRAFNEENRDYTRAWNQDERDYTRNWNEDERSYDRTMTEAANRAEYGDFSGYAAIYGSGVADAMRDVWIAQNPMVAYSQGAITAEEYQMLTGKYPYNSSGGSSYSGYRSGGGGGGYGGGYGSGSGNGTTSAADEAYNTYIQNTYNQNAAALGWGSSIPVTGQYDSPTQAAEARLIDYNDRQMVHGFNSLQDYINAAAAIQSSTTPHVTVGAGGAAAAAKGEQMRNAIAEAKARLGKS